MNTNVTSDTERQTCTSTPASHLHSGIHACIHMCACLYANVLVFEKNRFHMAANKVLTLRVTLLLRFTLPSPLHF